MKNILLYTTTLLVLLFGACQKEFEPTPEAAQPEASHKNALADNSIPKLYARATPTSGLYRLHILHPTQSQSSKLPGRLGNWMKAGVLLGTSMKASIVVENPTSPEPLEERSFVIDRVKGQAIVDLQFSAPIEQQILRVSFAYFQGEESVASYNYSVYVFENGHTALQAPAIERFSWTGRSWSGTGTTTLGVRVSNDPAHVVTDIKVEATYGRNIGDKAKAVEYKRRLDESFSIPVRFASDPTGYTFDTQLTMTDAKGQAVGASLRQPITIQRIPSPYRVIDLKLTHDIDPDSKQAIAANGLMGGVQPADLDYVEVEVESTDAKAGPILFRMRQRPEILYQEWDNLIDEHLTEIQNNPLHTDETADVNPLFEAGFRAGQAVHITTRIYDIRGKQLGEAQYFDTQIGASADLAEPSIKSTSLTSRDGGKTWQFAVVIDDPGQWVERLTVAFQEPFDGVKYLQGEYKLYPSGKPSGTQKTFVGDVVLQHGDIRSWTYHAIIQQYGTGTRTTATQANSKAELL